VLEKNRISNAAFEHQRDARDVFFSHKMLAGSE
jgi:hypothetical protein